MKERTSVVINNSHKRSVDRRRKIVRMIRKRLPNSDTDHPRVGRDICNLSHLMSYLCIFFLFIWGEVVVRYLVYEDRLTLDCLSTNS